MIYGAIFVVSSIYALILYHLSRECRPILFDHMFWLVAIWAGYLLVGLSWLVPRPAWDRVVGVVVVGLMPMGVLHLVASWKRQRRLVEYLLLRGQDDRAETVAEARGVSADRGYSQGPGDHGEGQADE